MWFHKWFKPVQKIQPTQDVTQLTQQSLKTPSTPLKQLCQTVDIDRVCRDAVMRRYLITVHWADIQSLFEAVLNNKRGSATLVAVNLYSYFKTAGTPASVCLIRLSDMLETTSPVPHSVSTDVDTIVNMFNQLGENHPELKMMKE